ncbi:MAG: peptidase [Flavonifractor sp.]|nr:peptidase [Flavonifractor sp.]
MMNKVGTRLGALALALVLCSQMLLPALAAEGDTVFIASTQELVRLAEHCVSDAWSEGRTVVLTADLELNGSFTPIPVFRGTFDGNGHTISGVVLTEKGSSMGLFRYLEEGAVVKNLGLEAEVAPGGSAVGVGALAGENRGTVERVTVSGSVTGAEDVGGLVGVNGESGLLRGCTNGANVTGTSRTGGLAGQNLGRIENCTNTGAVNTNDNPEAKDAGGIAGLNPGTLQGCVNRGEVGYNHVGYNVGGIAGRQNGVISGCTNAAPVSGRKDVGGIVGQFEPYVRLTYGEDPAARLDRTMAELFRLLDQLAGQVNRLTGDAVEDLEAINTSLSGLRETVHQGGTEGLEDVGVTGNRVYDDIQTMNRAMGNLLAYWDEFSMEANGDLEEVNRQLHRVSQAVDRMLGAVDSGISGSYREMDEAVERLEADSAGISRELNELGDEIRRLERFLQEVAQAAADFDLEGIVNAFRSWSLGSIDLGGHVRRTGDYIEDMGSALEHLWAGLSAVQGDSSEELNQARADGEQAAAELREALDCLNEHARQFSEDSSQSLQMVNDSLDHIEDTVHTYWNQQNANSQARLDEMNGHLEDVSKQLDALTQGTAGGNQELHATTTAIIGQLDQARQAVNDLIEGPSKTVEDGSQEELTGPGLVTGCRNTAAVQGDVNTGGIAGTVAPELSSDPEQDINLELEDVLVDTLATVSAAIQGCDNQGEILVKNGSAGGILGRAETGAVLECVSRGAVTASNGGRCGGIAGYSKGTIRNCAAQADLSGTSELGGIAGWGTDLFGCTAMTRILEGGERTGAIAGWVDGVASGNWYLREETAGIDGIDYAGRAEPLDWADFSALEGVPEEFLQIEVTFQAGERVVKRITVPYGGNLDPMEIPDVPAVEGDFGAWEEFDTSRITRSLTVEAQYSGWVSTISSGGERPLLLAQGSFTPEARLILTEREDLTGTLWEGRTIAAAYDYRIEDIEPLSGEVMLRLFAGGAGERAQAGVGQDGALVLSESWRDGSYLVFAGESQGTVVVFAGPEENGPVILLVCAAGGAAALLAAKSLRGRKKRPVAAAK